MLVDNRVDDTGGGDVSTVNGQTGDVVITASSLGLTDLSSLADYREEVCNDNAQTDVEIGPAQNEVYAVLFALRLNVSGKKITGSVRIGYDDDLIFDVEYSYADGDISGIELLPKIELGVLYLTIGKTAVGENSTFKYSIMKITEIV